MNRKKISFDFDETLDRVEVQTMAKCLIDAGHDVYITSQRVIDDNWNQDIYNLAKKLNIKKENVRIIGYASKYTYLKDFQIHFDDNKLEIEEINKKTNCIGILI